MCFAVFQNGSLSQTVIPGVWARQESVSLKHVISEWSCSDWWELWHNLLSAFYVHTVSICMGWSMLPVQCHTTTSKICHFLYSHFWLKEKWQSDLKSLMLKLGAVLLNAQQCDLSVPPEITMSQNPLRFISAFAFLSHAGHLTETKTGIKNILKVHNGGQIVLSAPVQTMNVN